MEASAEMKAKITPLFPDPALPSGSHQRIWWRCENGHLWKAPVYSVTAGVGCPYCAGRRALPGVSDLATTHSALAAEWDKRKNVHMELRWTSAGSEKSAWWRCEKGHSYRARVFSRAAGTGCPYCAGRKVLPGFNDLASAAPLVAREWCAPLNGELTPEQVTPGSKKKVWWECPAGHVWQAAVYSRTRERASGCPVCMKEKKRTAR